MMSPESTPPRFPQRALRSKAVLYRPLQDIDFYVEDEDSEAFYTELLRRLTASSGVVSLPRIRDMRRLRCFVLSLSISWPRVYQEPSSGNC